MKKLWAAKWVRVLALIGAIVLILLLAFIHYSESPEFCRSCHIMKPYYEAWSTSSHSFVKCVDCHYPAGVTPRQFAWKKFQSMSQVAKYVTRTYGTRPYAEIDDSSCLREGCHAKRLLSGKVAYKEHVVFDHRPHLLDLRRGKQLRCTSCHSQIVQGQHIEVTNSTCFICHFKKDKNGKRPAIAQCATCHKMPEGQIKRGSFSFSHKDFAGSRALSCEKCHADSIIGEGTVSKDKCYDCHNQPDRIAKYSDTSLMHQNHVTNHKVECIRCHEEIKHHLGKTIDPLETQCSLCHVKKHGGVREMYLGKSGRGIASSPSAMFTHQVDCKGCHIVPSIPPEDVVFKGQTFKTTQVSCRGCHDQSYDAILDSWKTALKSSLEKLAANLQETEKWPGLKKNPQAAALLKDARYNYYFVKDAKGVHNFDYATALLEKAQANLDQARALVK